MLLFRHRNALGTLDHGEFRGRGRPRGARQRRSNDVFLLRWGSRLSDLRRTRGLGRAGRFLRRTRCGFRGARRFCDPFGLEAAVFLSRARVRGAGFLRRASCLFRGARRGRRALGRRSGALGLGGPLCLERELRLPLLIGDNIEDRPKFFRGFDFR